MMSDEELAHTIIARFLIHAPMRVYQCQKCGLVALTAAIVIPTLPNSRRVRLILSVIAVPTVVFSYQRIAVYASYIGATHMGVFIERSERLLKEGKTQILLEAYQDYREQHGGRIPKSSAAAYRAFLLDSLLKQREMEKDTKP